MRGGDEGFAKMFHSLRHETKLIFGIVHLRRGILGERPERIDLPAEGAARLVTCLEFLREEIGIAMLMFAIVAHELSQAFLRYGVAAMEFRETVRIVTSGVDGRDVAEDRIVETGNVVVEDEV